MPAPICFPLGVVIYQMATGRLPFSGATSAVIFHAILELDPIPALQLKSHGYRQRLGEILGKALEKDRDLRYQSAGDLRGDLKRLKRDTEGRKEQGRQSSGAAAVTPASSKVSTPAGANCGAEFGCRLGCKAEQSGDGHRGSGSAGGAGSGRLWGLFARPQAASTRHLRTIRSGK